MLTPEETCQSQVAARELDAVIKEALIGLDHVIRKRPAAVGALSRWGVEVDDRVAEILDLGEARPLYGDFTPDGDIDPIPDALHAISAAGGRNPKGSNNPANTGFFRRNFTAYPWRTYAQLTERRRVMGELSEDIAMLESLTDSFAERSGAA